MRDSTGGSPGGVSPARWSAKLGDMVGITGARYAFGAYLVDVDAREIRRDGHVVPVEPQVFDVLVVLLREHHRVVGKEELLTEIWGTRFVGESALTSRVKALRRALGDDGRSQAVIKTAHGRGFRFVAPLAPAPPAPSVGAGSVSDLAEGLTASVGSNQIDAHEDDQPIHQDVRFCTATDGTRLAYAWLGQDGPPLVKVANWLSHLEYDAESPIWRHWLVDLATRYRLLRYDERGCGLSDLDVEQFSVDAWVDDLLTVIDAAGLERVPLLGISQGGSVAIAFAVRYPERVSKLVLYGAYGRGPIGRARTPEARREAELMPELAALGWGREQPIFRQIFTMKFLPEGSPRDWDLFNELQRRSTTPQNASRFLTAFNEIDVENLAGQVQVPTLVLHARRDHLPPVEEGRRLAALIPGSRFVTLDSPNHLILGHEPAWAHFLAHLDAFLAEPDQ